MINEKTSLLVKNQVPNYIVEEYPKFILFLEAYYEFLEKEHPELSISNNNLTERLKKLKTLNDVDVSLDEFEQQFYSTFLSYLPRDLAVSKDIMIKNISKLYASKGSESSYKLLFRMLFDKSVELSYPRDNILRLSDGKWVSENVLLITDYFYTTYISNGVKTNYYLSDNYESFEFEIYIDDVLTTSYTYDINYKEIEFNSAPSLNSIIKIVYLNFDAAVFRNRKVTGLTSNANAIIERVNKNQTGAVSFYEFFISEKTRDGTFSNAETFISDIFVDEILVPIYFKTYSILKTINIVESGSSYNIGDTFVIYGNAEEFAIGLIDDVVSGNIDGLNVFLGGAGFKVDNSIIALGYDPSAFISTVTSVDSSGLLSSNTVTINTDVISEYLGYSLDGTYPFPANTSATLTAYIGDTLENTTINDLGSITSVAVSSSSISSEIEPIFDAIPEVANTSYPDITIRDFGIIGKIKINSGGTNYANGDYLVFSTDLLQPGFSANAEVLVSDTGVINRIIINSGGYDYSISDPPVITVDSATGSDANLELQLIMGDGEQFNAVSDEGIAGSIKSMSLISPGLNYVTEPTVDLTILGDGNALARVEVDTSYKTLQGSWKNEDGKLSNPSMRIQGKDYYIDFSYVLSSQVEFRQYKEVLKNLLHPSGLINYSKYIVPIDTIVATNTINIESNETTTV